MPERDYSFIMPYKKKVNLFTFMLILTLIKVSTAFADIKCQDCIVFPLDSGHLNVRNFGAKGDGITDDTEALNAAIAASGADLGRTIWQDRIVYLPNGTYLVTKPIQKKYANGSYASGLILVGESREKTIIQLKNYAPLYSNKNSPRPIIFTTSKLLASSPYNGGRDYPDKGEGNDAYMNTIENLTVDAGIGNPGAIGIDYLANNLGAIRNVTIRAPLNSGSTGISMIRKWPGPALLQNTLVEGFDIGIDLSQTEYGMTIENLILRRQKEIGLRNNQNVISAHQITIEDTKTPIQNKHINGLIVITQGHFKGPIDGHIENKGYLNLRGIKIDGYKNILGTHNPSTQLLDGIYKFDRKFSASLQPWSLPIKYPPHYELPVTETWANVQTYGAIADSNRDSTDGIIRAFASGRSVIYFPHGTYLISKNIIVPSSVKHIIGMTSTIAAFPIRPPSFDRKKGMFRTSNMRSPLTIERLTFDHTNLGNQVGIEAIGEKPLILRDIFTLGTTMLDRPVGSGEVFLENVCCGSLDISGNKGVWARQLNSEGGTVRILNRGAPLWILGLKTERNTTVIKNTGGATTELLGGLIYMVEPVNGRPVAAFINQNSKLLLSYVEEAFDSKSTYAVHLLNKKAGNNLQTTRAMLPPRNEGRIAPLLIAD